MNQLKMGELALMEQESCSDAVDSRPPQAPFLTPKWLCLIFAVSQAWNKVLGFGRGDEMWGDSLYLGEGG